MRRVGRIWQQVQVERPAYDSQRFVCDEYRTTTDWTKVCEKMWMKNPERAKITAECTIAPLATDL